MDAPVRMLYSLGRVVVREWGSDERRDIFNGRRLMDLTGCRNRRRKRRIRSITISCGCIRKSGDLIRGINDGKDKDN